MTAQIRKACWFSLESLFNYKNQNNTNNTNTNTNDQDDDDDDAGASQSASDGLSLSLDNDNNDSDDSTADYLVGAGESKSADDHQYQHEKGQQVEEQEQDKKKLKKKKVKGEVGGADDDNKSSVQHQLPQTRSRKRSHQPADNKDSYFESAGVRRRLGKTWSPATANDDDDDQIQGEDDDDDNGNNDYVRVLRSGKTRVNKKSSSSSSGGVALTRNHGKVQNNTSNSKSVFIGNNNKISRSQGAVSRGKRDQDFEEEEEEEEERKTINKMGAIKCTSSNCDKSSPSCGGQATATGKGGGCDGGGCNDFPANNFNSLVSSTPAKLCDKCILLVCNNNGKGGDHPDMSVALGGTEKKKKKRVFSYSEAPSYLKFNPYITGGYRTALTPKECVKSLFWWTNETLNIWSHLLGWLFFLGLSVYDSLGLLNLPTTQPWDQIIITLLLVCFQACMLLSALYHVFCCCSEKFYRRWLSADLFGVSLSLLAIYISGIYYAFSCVPFWLNFYLITVGAIFASAMVMQIIPVVVRPTTEEAFHWRLIVFGGWAAYGIVPTFHWAVLHGGMSSPVVALLLPRIFWMYGISIAAFIFYVFRLPEKLYPGSVNYIFSSHQLWHLLIVLALYHWHNTGLLYLQFRAQNTCEAEYDFLFPSSQVLVPPVES